MADPTADELAIRNLMARYAEAVSLRDVGQWTETWAEDASWHLLGRDHSGLEEIVAAFRAALGMLRFVLHVVHTGVVEVHGDEASGRWMVSELGQVANGAPFRIAGRYHDTYRRTDDGWRFASRRLELLYQGATDMSGKAFPPAVSE